MAEQVIDELESGDIHDDDRDAMTALLAHLAQCPVEPIHEVAPIRQSGEGVVKTRVIEGLLKIQPLLYFRGKLLTDRMHTATRGRQGLARALQRVAHFVSAEGQQPAQKRQKRDLRHEEA